MRIDEFGMHNIESNQVQGILLLTLASKVAHHIGDAIIAVAGRESPRLFQPCPEARDIKSCLTTEEPKPQTQLTWWHSLRCQDVLQDRGIARRATDGRDAEIADNAQE